MLWTTWLDVMILHQGWYAQVHPLKASPPRWGSLLQYAVQNQINNSQLIKFSFSQYNTGRRKQQWGALNVHFIRNRKLLPVQKCLHQCNQRRSGQSSLKAQNPRRVSSTATSNAWLTKNNDGYHIGIAVIIQQEPSSGGSKQFGRRCIRVREQEQKRSWV